MGSHPINGGLRSLRFADHPLGAMWRAADLLRELRGDSHVISWAVGGADAVEILLLTEQWWGVPARSYTPSRGWSDADMDAGFDRLTRRGLMSHGEQLTDAGRAFREEVEVPTDELERPVLEALGGAVLRQDLEGRRDRAGELAQQANKGRDRHPSRRLVGIAAGAAVGVLFAPAVGVAAVVGGVSGGVSGHLAKGMSRSQAKELGEFIDPGQAGLIVVGESKVKDAIQKAVTRAEKQTGEDLSVDPKDLDKALQETMKEM